MAHPDTLIVELTRREAYSLYAAAHQKPQSLLKGDLHAAFHKIEEALGSAGPTDGASESVAPRPDSASDMANVGPAEFSPKRRGW